MNLLSHKLEWEKANDLWAASLNPILSNPINNSVIIKNVVLQVGSNTINHGLGHAITGWQIIDINGVATIYRSAPMNNLTLTLTSSANVTVSLEVF